MSNQHIVVVNDMDGLSLLGPFGTKEQAEAASREPYIELYGHVCRESNLPYTAFARIDQMHSVCNEHGSEIDTEVFTLPTQMK